MSVRMRNSSILPFTVLLSHPHNHSYICSFSLFQLVVTFCWSTVTFCPASSSIHSARWATWLLFVAFMLLQLSFQSWRKYASEGGGSCCRKWLDSLSWTAKLLHFVCRRNVPLQWIRNAATERLCQIIYAWNFAAFFVIGDNLRSWRNGVILLEKKCELCSETHLISLQCFAGHYYKERIVTRIGCTLFSHRNKNLLKSWAWKIFHDGEQFDLKLVSASAATAELMNHTLPNIWDSCSTVWK